MVGRARRLLSSFSLGLASQALAFGAGIIVVRSLTRQDYASYSLSTTIISAVVVLADAGINSTMMAAAARVENAGRFRPLLAAALRWRRVVWAIAVVPMLALLFYLLLGTGVAPVVAAVVCALTGALSFNSLSVGLASIEYQISGRFSALQIMDVASNALRLALLATAGLLGVAGVILYLVLGLLIGVAQQRVMLSRISARHVDGPLTGSDSALFSRAIRSTVIVSLAIVLGDQLVNFILVQRGNPLAVADIAALSRFALAFGLLNTVMANIAAPYVARAGSTRPAVLRASALVVGVYGAACAAYVVFVWLAAPLLLTILGPQYDHLRVEMVVLAVGSAVSNFASWGTGLITHARGWLAHSWIYGVLLVLWAVYGYFVADVSTTLGAVTLVATLALPSLVSQIIRLVAGFRGLERGSTPMEERVAGGGGPRP